MKEFSIHSAKSSEVILLRHEVLRPHQTPNECHYDMDDLHETKHWKACNPADEIIGIITLFPENLKNEKNTLGYRIRGMAISPKAQGLGVGSALLEKAIADKDLDSKGYVWCNARSTAIGFYQKNGFEIVGEPFDVPGLGEHFIAKRAL